MVRQMETGYANVHRGLHYLANEATEAFEGARESVRAFLNAGSVDEIVFTKSATEAYNLVADSFGRMAIGEGDEIVLSIMEHHSNIVPWHFLRERKGAVIKWAPVDDEGNFLLEEFEKLLSPRTRIVAITHMSNVLGTVTPMKEIIRIAHAHGVPVLVDGAQGAVHLAVDVRDLDADFYVFTGHKVYGPTGIGVLYGKREWLERMPPYQGGGEMIREVTAGRDHLQRAAAPLRGRHAADRRGDRARRGAALHDGARPREHRRRTRHALSAYAARAARADELAPDHRQGAGQGRHHLLRDEGRPRPRRRDRDRPRRASRCGPAPIAPCRCSSASASTSTCRASFGLYNTIEEVDKLVDALQKAETLFA